MKLRKPYKKELRQLASYLYGCDFDEVIADIKASDYIAIMEGYTSTYNKYEGKLMLVVSDFCPGGYELYIWRNGEITPVDQHADQETCQQFFLKARPCEVCTGKSTWKECLHSVRG